MRILFTSFLSFFTLLTFAQPCIDGYSGVYPCENVDQLSFVGLDELGGEEMNDVWGWTSPETGREYVCAAHTHGTAFLDVSNPAYPQLLGILPTHTESSVWRDVKVYDHYAFIVSEAIGHGMQVFDLSQLETLSFDDIPVTFDEDAHYDAFGNSHNVAINESEPYAYAIGTGTFSGGPHVVDISDPLNPVYAGSSAEAGYTHDAQVVTYHGPDEDYFGHEIAVGSNDEYIAVYDVTDKTDIEVISITSYEDVAYAHQSWFTEDHRFMLSNDEQDELYIPGISTTRTIMWDMQDLDNPQVIGYHDLGTTSIDHNLYIKDNAAYLSNYTSGLRLLDVSDLENANLEEFGFFDVSPTNDLLQFSGTWSNYPFFGSGVVPTTSIESGLHILKPRLVSSDSLIYFACNQDAEVQLEVNLGLGGNANLSLQMDEVPGNNALFSATSIPTPGSATVTFAGSSTSEAGYYTGIVLVESSDYSYTVPVVIVVGQSLTSEATLNYPVDEETVGEQEVTFSFNSENFDYWQIQVATDADFENIVADFWGSGETDITKQLPYDYTQYFWRVIQPGCDEYHISATETFYVNSEYVGIAENLLENVKNIYPNPARDEINVQLKEPVDYIEVTDLLGRTIHRVSAKNSGRNIRMDVSQLESGVYLLQPSGAYHAAKFIIQ